MEEAQAPGLRWRVTKGGKTPIWRATKAAVKAGYPVKSANLAPFAHDERVLRQRCQRLQAEMIAWMSGQRERPMNFDGTFASLISIYQRDAESPYKKLKPSSRHPYDVYCRMLTLEIGARRIDACDGRDARRWFKAWSDPVVPDGRRRIAAARMATIVLKTALSFGKACRLPGCAEFKTTIEDIRFQAPAPRQEAPSAAEIVRLRQAARQIGHAPAALAYALQFEASLRQWDVSVNGYRSTIPGRALSSTVGANGSGRHGRRSTTTWCCASRQGRPKEARTRASFSICDPMRW